MAITTTYREKRHENAKPIIIIEDERFCYVCIERSLNFPLSRVPLIIFFYYIVNCTSNPMLFIVH